MVSTKNYPGRLCPLCGEKSKVLNTRDREGRTVRYRECLGDRCRYRFTTVEARAEMEVRRIGGVG